EAHAKKLNSFSEPVSRDFELIGSANAEKTFEGVKRIKDSVHLLGHVLHELRQRSAQIGKIVIVLEQVSKQSKLLALNLAITVSRGGDQKIESGDIINEIKKLGDRTAESTNEISELTSKVQLKVPKSFYASQIHFASIENGIQLSSESENGSKRIVENTDKMQVNSQKFEIARSEQVVQIRQMNLALEQINNMFHIISSSTGQQEKESELIFHFALEIKESARMVQKLLRGYCKGSIQMKEVVENADDGAKQISRPIEERKQDTDYNSDSMEEIDRASHETVQLAQDLDRLVPLLVQQVNVLKSEIERYKI
ncbi:MAG: hypothetical protein HYR80_06640, partial [Nitrospirae bacterium]|nr:hypothetical protein [Nitrospirota bacterium]